jgi:predicted nucleic acid-binding protein
MANGWTEVQPDEAIRKRAIRLLSVHSLTAGDALQLAAALQWSDDRGGGGEFISLDERLRDAASREGLICP